MSKFFFDEPNIWGGDLCKLCRLLCAFAIADFLGCMAYLNGGGSGLKIAPAIRWTRTPSIRCFGWPLGSCRILDVLLFLENWC